MNINEIPPQSNPFTQILTTIAVVPERLYYAGNLPAKRQPTVAIVGTRKPTKYGIEVTQRLAYDLAKRGIVIVSGLALGVDALAQRAALEAGGTTISVLGSGLHEITPTTNRQLGEDIIKSGGAIISEYPTGIPPYPSQFLARNRLVSGLSDAILITEASAHSGTLNTAMHALDQNREVFVVPGNITSPLSSGCNALLRQGATPVTCADDILQVIAPELLKPQSSLALGDNQLQTTIIQLLQAGVRDGEQLQAQAEVSAGEFATELTMLEIAGSIRPLGGNQWTLK